MPRPFEEREAAGLTVAARLYAAERAVDAALAETAGLMVLLPQARTQANLSATTGQNAFDDVAAAIGALTNARARLVGAHGGLAALARRMGLDSLAVGPLDKPEDAPPHGGEGVSSHARVIGKQIPIELA